MNLIEVRTDPFFGQTFGQPHRLARCEARAARREAPHNVSTWQEVFMQGLEQQQAYQKENADGVGDDNKLTTHPCLRIVDGASADRGNASSPDP